MTRSVLWYVSLALVAVLPQGVRGLPQPLALIAASAASAASAAAASPRALATPTGRLPVVDRAIAHHGGERYRSSEAELDICSASGCFHLLVRTDGDRFDHTVSNESGARKVRVTNDTVESWRDGEARPVEPEEEQRLRDWASARVYFPFLPYRLNDPSVYKEDLGLEVWEGEEYHKVKVTFESGTSSAADDAYLYWFDPETSRVERFAYSFQGNPGGLRFRRCFNYRRVGGILFFDQENFGLDAPGLTVDDVTPEFVKERMRLVSTVRLRDIEVRDLDGG